MGDRPDILFLFSDQHTRKVAGCYGDTVAQTPNLDRLAQRGVTFDQAYCPSPLCVPSRMSLLTGRWPYEQRCWTLSDTLASDIPTFAHGLGTSGYRTILCGRLHAIGSDQLHGFDTRLVGDCSPDWPGAARQELGVLAGAQGPSSLIPEGERLSGSAARSLHQSGSGQSGYEVVDDAVTDAACQQLIELGEARRCGDKTPFLLSVGYLLPHCPYVARKADFDRFRDRVGGVRLPRAPDEHPYITRWRTETGLDVVDPEDTAVARTAYYALVHALDRKLGQVLDTLESAGLSENTLIVYASDHGEHLGERDLWWKNTFFEESVGIPLVLSWPARLPQGTRCARVVNLLDVGATMLAAAAAEPLPYSHGHSLLDIASDATAPWQDQTFSEYVTDQESGWTGSAPTQQRMLRHGRFKYVHIEGYRPQLFDLEADPLEAHDLGDDPACQDICQWLASIVLADWDPQAIAREITRRAPQKRLLHRFAAATQPASRYRFELTAADSWLDPLAR